MNSPESVPMLSNLKAYLHYQYPATTGDILLNAQCDYITSLESDKAMLDWLDGHKTGNYEAPYWKIYTVNQGDNLRQAITQAMKGDKAG